LRDLGWIDGKNIRIEYRWGDNKPERLAPLAEELVRLNAELIVASSTAAVQAAKNATTTIPIIMGAAADAEGSGFVASLARPGGNITGVSMMMPAMSGKLLELLREITPRLSRVAYLGYASDPGQKMFLMQTQEAGYVLKIGVQAVVVNSAAEFEHAFAAMKAGRAEALIVHPIFTGQLGLGSRIAELAKKHRLPTISDGPGFAEAGGLLYFGSDAPALFNRIAGYVDRILKGAKPADMPVEQPQKFQLLVNMKTAKQLALKVPQSLLLRADRVIE
jgi:putative ABC transport system substrate-binding protein